MYYASICAIAKDEDRDIREWLLYHFTIGFEHVLLYDNNSKIPLRTTLAQFIDAGLVTVIDFPLTEGQQLSAYINALYDWGANTRWLAYIDIDEFILPLQNDDIRDLLDDYTDYAALCANWCIFSANGHISRPDGGILENYTDCLGLDPHIKSIVQPKLTNLAKSAHHFTFQDGYYCVNEDKIPVRNFHTYLLANKICVNHYYYKSQQDFCMKMARGLGTKVKTNTARKITIFYEHLQRQGFRNDAILRFKPKMNKFARFPMAAVADIVQTGSRKDLLQGLAEIEAALERDQVLHAARIHTVLCRYHSGFELDIVGANLAFLQGKQEAGLALLRRLMSRPDVSADDLKQCYRALENYYALTGEPAVKAAIKQYLG